MKLIFILVILSFFGCAKRVNSSSVIAYKKDVYEKISDVKIPGKSIVLQTYDNDDFFTFTTLKVDSLTLVNFVRSKKFKRRIDTEFPPLFFGAEELKDNKPDAKYRDYSYYLEGTKGKDNWLYIADIKRSLLWVEVIYVDKL